MFTAEELERYARHIVLREVGGPGQQRLKAAKVLVIGAGGLGAPLLLYLAAAGVGTIGIVDDDAVALSNLQRQVIHRSEDVGILKTESAANAIRRLNPHVEVVSHVARLTPDNAPDLLGPYDIVADGSDNFATRYAVSDAPSRAASRTAHILDNMSVEFCVGNPRATNTGLGACADDAQTFALNTDLNFDRLVRPHRLAKACPVDTREIHRGSTALP